MGGELQVLKLVFWCADAERLLCYCKNNNKEQQFHLCGMCAWGLVTRKNCISDVTRFLKFPATCWLLVCRRKRATISNDPWYDIICTIPTQFYTHALHERNTSVVLGHSIIDSSDRGKTSGSFGGCWRWVHSVHRLPLHCNEEPKCNLYYSVCFIAHTVTCKPPKQERHNTPTCCCDMTISILILNLYCSYFFSFHVLNCSNSLVGSRHYSQVRHGHHCFTPGKMKKKANFRPHESLAPSQSVWMQVSAQQRLDLDPWEDKVANHDYCLRHCR